MQVSCAGQYKEESVAKKFLGLKIDNHLNWTNHIDKLISKFRRARYEVRYMCHIIETDTLNQSLQPIFTL